MKIINTRFKNLRIIKHKRFSDKRGSLRETYNKRIFNWDKFVFHYTTISKKKCAKRFSFSE